MLKYIIKRLLWVIPVLLGASLLIFTLLHFAPGKPSQVFLGSNATEEEIAAFNEKHGLDQPFFTQYFTYMKNIITKFDFGNSYKNNVAVSQRIKETYPVTFRLAISALLIMVAIGLPLGVLSAIKQYSILDNIASVLGMLGVSMPNFWLGLQLILLFAYRWQILPPSGFSSPKHYILPALTLGVAGAAALMRTTRSSMLEVIRQDYIKTVRAKGQKESVVIWRHMLKNAMLPIITSIAQRFCVIMGSSLVIENIFAIPGICKLMMESITLRDYIVVIGCVLTIAFTCSIVNLLTDLSYALIDPRIKAQFKNQSKRNKKKEDVG